MISELELSTLKKLERELDADISQVLTDEMEEEDHNADKKTSQTDIHEEEQTQDDSGVRRICVNMYLQRKQSHFYCVNTSYPMDNW